MKSKGEMNMTNTKNFRKNVDSLYYFAGKDYSIMIKDPEQSCSEFDDLNFTSAPASFDSGPTIHVAFERGYSKSSFRNTILCTFYKCIDYEGRNPSGFMSIGIASCSKEDIFDLNAGRKLAFKRALKEIGNKDLRERLWKDFHMNNNLNGKVQDD